LAWSGQPRRGGPVIEMQESPGGHGGAKQIGYDYLRGSRSALVWKLDGLADCDLRRLLVGTGTNLLGLVKHVASMEALFFGVVFDRPYDEELAWLAEDAPLNSNWRTRGWGPGGRASTAASRCAKYPSTWWTRRHVTWFTPTSCASSSTGAWAVRPVMTISPPLIRHGGMTT
ncbi:MAG TPA: DUF664 domain-containing protein, partial [Acidimicrobiales bacterium]|nr:DUF664 domain-containing protein [Acidimicrobiales bacterium]